MRLPGFDYAQEGSYFVTICSAGRQRFFGDVVDGQVRLNEFGQVAARSWEWLARHFPHVELDEWVLMPNHLHGIIVITDDRRGGSRTAPTNTSSGGFRRKPLGGLIGAFKTVSTRKINAMRLTPGMLVWQRNYYEHIVRSEDSLREIRQYIVNNPTTWEVDELYSAGIT